jgi:hypothetical protein
MNSGWEGVMPDVNFGDVAAWGFIIGAIAYVGAHRFGVGPAVTVSMLAALTTKAALLRLT